MMELNKNSEPECVIGKPYSYSTLMGMTKKELIGLLGIAQRNYGVVNARLYNSNSYLERLNKALNRAVKLLNENMLCEKCPFPKNTERCTVEGCKDYLKECLLKDE